MPNFGRYCLISLGLLGLAAPASAADAFSSDWANGLKSAARLISAGASDGVIHAGVEIKLAPGAITYWRNPGDAGLPPTLSFEGSTNLAQIRTYFPAPRRLAEKDGGEAFGYDGTVILPIEINARDAKKPVEVALKINYAVCEAICVPAEASLRLTLQAGAAGPSPFADPIAKATTLVPRPVEWAGLSADLTSTSDKAWRLCLAPQAGPKRDVFIEAPESWWFDVRRDSASASGGDCFSLSLAQQPQDGKLPVSLRLTIAGGGGPVETTIALAPRAKL